MNEVYVFASQDPFDDPVKELVLNATLTCNINTFVKNDKITIIVSPALAQSIVTLEDNLHIQDENTKKQATMAMFNSLVNSYKTNMKDIDILQFLKAKSGIEFENIKLGNFLGYNTLLIDINTKLDEN